MHLVYVILRVPELSQAGKDSGDVRTMPVSVACTSDLELWNSILEIMQFWNWLTSHFRLFAVPENTDLLSCGDRT